MVVTSGLQLSYTNALLSHLAFQLSDNILEAYFFKNRVNVPVDSNPRLLSGRMIVQ